MDEDDLIAAITALQGEVADLMNQLGTRLNELGLIEDNLEYVNARSGDLEVTNEQLGIIWNYRYLLEDQSMGVHNPTYAKALLINSLEALN